MSGIIVIAISWETGKAVLSMTRDATSEWIKENLDRSDRSAESKKAQILRNINELQTHADIYQLRTGSPINSLDDLVPDYIEELPKYPDGRDYIIEKQNDGTVKVRTLYYGG